MTSDVAVAKNSLGLDATILKNLESYDDFLSFYVQLEETSSAFSWLKADLLHEFVKKHGEKSLDALSQDIKQPRPTINNYSRLAKAFPTEKRIQNLSFTGHLVACFADSFDTKKDDFVTQERFTWAQQAADEGWSTRKLHRKIQEVKDATPNLKRYCTHCGKNEGEIQEYIIYRIGVRKAPEKFDLHEDCYIRIQSFIEQF